VAKAGRVLAGRNEARLGRARDVLATGFSNPKAWREAIAAMTEVLNELDRYTTAEGEAS
jgi:hypothetical protein